jgi:hypothetical protein
VTISTDLGVQDVHYDPYDVVVNAALPDIRAVTRRGAAESRYIAGVSLPVDAGSLLK